MKSSITLPTSSVIKKPTTLSFEEAASIPTVFLTATYGLERLAKIKKGDKVLIHACAGGVGQAALQVAQRAGAIVYATASKGKWDFLKSQGVKYIMNSRTLDFANEIKRLTNGEGVDIILNSLKGEYIPKNLDLLAANGRYVEIGKIDTWSKERVQEYRPDIQYFSFDLADKLRVESSFCTNLLTELVERFESGFFKVIPIKTFSFQKASNAFRYLAQAKNIGKVVLSLPQKPTKPIYDEKKYYVIAGGLGALGLKVAKILAKNGVKNLVLFGRSLPSNTAQLEMNSLRKEGINIQTFQTDISKKNEVEDLFKNLDSILKLPLGGIVQAAGILDDGMLQQQNWDRFSKVLTPKIKGTWILHQVTKDRPLDFFICFSSLTSVIGAPGQSNYAVANSFMDGLMQYRRSINLPALSINWGPWNGGGMATKMDKISKQRLRNMGLDELSVTEADNIFATLSSKSNCTQVAAAPINWSKYFAAQRQKTFNPFLEAYRDQQLENVNGSFLNSLQNSPPEEREELLFDHIRTQIAEVLGFDSPKEITARQRLFDLGIDSLMAVEVQNRLSKSLGMHLTSSLIFDYPTLEALTNYLLLELFPEERRESPNTIKANTSDASLSTSKISNLSEEELAIELAKLVETMESS